VRVIDSSALIKYFTREEGWEKVREILLDGVATLDLAVKEPV
jgi:predicted nucleic acid-binding protein